MDGTSERVRGFVLYGAAALLLAGGGTWFYRTAPDTGPDPRFARWHATAEKLLPDGVTLADSGTLDLVAGTDRMVRANVGTGFYQVAAVCVGGQGSTVQISASDDDSATRNLSCADGSSTASFPIGADTLLMHVTVNESGPVVFRYTVIRLIG